MLQRIQSIYLFLVFVFGILYAVLPIAQLSTETAGFSFRILTYRTFFDQTVFSANWQGILLLIIWAAILVLTVYMTFQYKNRLLQIKLGKTNILLHVFITLLTFYFLDNLRNQVENIDLNYGPGVLFPVISLIFILMAIKAIKKDEELIRSADRFR